MRYAKVNYSYDPETQTALQLEENQNGRTHMLASNNIRDTTVVEIYGKPVSNREKSNAALARRLEADKDKAEIWLNGLIEKSKRNPFGEVCKLTPALAVALLDRNPNNKNINSTILENIKCDINGGRWDFNGESIIVSRDGLLNDGQTRCTAVVATGKTIDTLIFFGAPRDSRMTVDTGAVRGVKDFNTMNGVENPKASATFATWVWQYRNKGRLGTGGKMQPTKTQAVEVVNECCSLQEHLAASSGCARMVSPSIVSFCHWLISSQGKKSDISQFFSCLIDGHSLDAKSPILSARRKLMSLKAKNKRDPHRAAEIIIEAWNMERAAAKKKKYTPRKTSDINSFPPVES